MLYFSQHRISVNEHNVLSYSKGGFNVAVHNLNATLVGVKDSKVPKKDSQVYMKVCHDHRSATPKLT